MPKKPFQLNGNLSTDGKGLSRHFNGLLQATGKLTVGIHKDAHDYEVDGKRTSVVMVAMVNEYGSASKGIPPRHFLSRSIEVDQDWYKEQIKRALKFYSHKDFAHNPSLIKTAYREIGRTSVQLIISHTENNDIGMTANAESTARAKGGNQPVVDSGHLLGQIDYKIGDERS